MKSVVSYPERGQYGNNRYRGNCSGRLIEDLIAQYKIQSFYPITWSEEERQKMFAGPSRFLVHFWI